MKYQLSRVFKYNNYQLLNGAIYQKRKLFSNHCPRTRVNSSETSTFLTTLRTLTMYGVGDIIVNQYVLHVISFTMTPSMQYSDLSKNCWQRRRRSTRNSRAIAFFFHRLSFFFRSKWIILRISYMSLFNKSSVFLLLQSNVFYSSFNHDTTEKQFVRTAEKQVNKKFELVPYITSN